MSYDGRFAPSPTGPLHLGSLRTALAAWLLARHAAGGRGRFLVRIEDLDPQRSRREWEAGQLADLSALGLDWDEPPVRQSERLASYEAALARLTEAGRVYPCFCTRAEIRAAAAAPHGERAEGAYPGTCRTLAGSERARRIAEGRPYALRLDAGGAGRSDGTGGSEGAGGSDRPGGRIGFEDRLLGPQATVVDDFVVRRADGVPAYQLAVVVDDAAQGVGEVVRGADLAESTPRQILLGQLLGLPIPSYAHVGLVLGTDGARLAKRHGAATLADRDEPIAVTRAVLAHSLGLAAGRDRVDSVCELLDGFDPDGLPRGPVTLG